MICRDCGKKIQASGVGTGYGIDAEGHKFCYDCAAARDLEYMRREGRISLYLVPRDTGAEIMNWPGTLKFKAIQFRRSKGYAFGGPIARRDAWFVLDGYIWHCISRGDTDLCRCVKTKSRIR